MKKDKNKKNEQTGHIEREREFGNKIYEEEKRKNVRSDIFKK